LVATIYWGDRGKGVEFHVLSKAQRYNKRKK
jgi:hypothetical protein